MESVEWLEEIGCAFKMKIGSATGSLGERSHYTVKPAGSGYTDAFRDWIANNPDKVTVVSNTQATELVQDAAGTVTGVKGVRGDGGEVSVSAKSVIIATGGFGSNVEFRQKVNNGVWSEVPLDDTIGCTNIKPCAQGDGMTLAEAAGAELIGLSDIQLHPCGTPGTGLMQHIRTSGRNRIFVNEEGSRFVSEGAARDELCKAIFAQSNSAYWVVVNKVRYPSLTEPDKDGEKMEDMIALDAVIAADTIDELAAATGMDAAKLQESIDTYNAVVAGEKEDPFGFKANNSADVQLTEGPWVRLQEGADGSPHDGRHKDQCRFAGARRFGQTHRWPVRRGRMHGRHPRLEPSGWQRHSRHHDVRPFRRPACGRACRSGEKLALLPATRRRACAGASTVHAMLIFSFFPCLSRSQSSHTRYFLHAISPTETLVHAGGRPRLKLQKMTDMGGLQARRETGSEGNRLRKTEGAARR